MIIKSMSRKDPSFGQLIHYMADIEKSDEQYNVYRNLYTRKLDAMEDEFLDNARYMAKRKNGVYLYHEILSITVAEKISREEQKAILRDIAYRYAEQRAENNLIFGTLHDDHDSHLHYHLIISANAVGDNRKTRLSKTQFDRFKKGMETLVLTQYPQLEQKVVINREAAEKASNKHGERQRRTKEPSQRDQVKSTLQRIFAEAKDKQSLFDALASEGMEIYFRGNNIGVQELANNRKYRLKTLGLMDDFQRISDKISDTETPQSKQKDSQKGSSEKDARSEQPQYDESTSHETEQPENAAQQAQAKREAEIAELRSKAERKNSQAQDKQ